MHSCHYLKNRINARLERLYSTILMDLSKAFDTNNLELLIAKLYAYRFSTDALKLIHNYISDRQQKVKTVKFFSSCSALLKGVPQRSVLGLILFNIYLNDLFCFLDCNICSFADDNILCLLQNPGFCFEASICFFQMV